MPCCLVAVGAFFPRVALVVMWLVQYSQPAFATVLWPLLGFFLMPYTTCFYAVAVNEFGGVSGLGLALVIVGVIFDLGSWGGSTNEGVRYRRTRTVRVLRD